MLSIFLSFYETRLDYKFKYANALFDCIIWLLFLNILQLLIV